LSSVLIGYRVGWARALSEYYVTVRVSDWMLSVRTNLTLNLHLDLETDVDGNYHTKCNKVGYNLNVVILTQVRLTEQTKSSIQHELYRPSQHQPTLPLLLHPDQEPISQTGPQEYQPVPLVVPRSIHVYDLCLHPFRDLPCYRVDSP